MYCPCCGAELSPHAAPRFCGHCGAPLTADPQPRTPADESAAQAASAPVDATDPPRRPAAAQNASPQPHGERHSGERHRSAQQNGEHRSGGRHSGNHHHSGHHGEHHSSHHGEHHSSHHSDHHSSHHSEHHSNHHRSHHSSHHSDHHSSHRGRQTSEQAERSAFSYRLAKTALLSAIAVTLSILVVIGLFADPVTSLSVSWFRPASGKITVPLQILGIAERNIFRLKSFDFDITYEDTVITGTVEWGADILSSRAAVTIKKGNDRTVAYYNNEKLMIAENNKRVSGFDMRMLLSMLNDPSDTFFDDMIKLFEQRGVNRAYPNWKEEVQRLSDAFYKLYGVVDRRRLDRDTLFSIANDATRFVFPMIVHNSPYKKKQSYRSAEEIPDFQALLDFSIEFFTNHLSKSALSAKRAGAGTNITYNLTVDPGAASRDLLEFIDQDDYFQAFCKAYGASSTTILKKIDFKNSRERFAESPIRVQTVMRHGYLNSFTATSNGVSLLRVNLSHKNTARVNPKDYDYIADLRTTAGVTDDYEDDPYNAVMYFLQTHIKEIPE